MLGGPSFDCPSQFQIFGTRSARELRMTLEVWIGYVAVVLALMSTPGPSQLLMLSNSLQNGARKATFTAFGDLTANSIQMLIAGLGLASVVTYYPNTLTVIKWLGAAYLTWLGLQMIRKADTGAGNGQEFGHKKTLRALWLQGFVTSAANPKAVVFFAALFPLFIVPDKPFAPQFFALSATYLVLDAMFLGTYGLLADWISKRFRGEIKQWIERLGGVFMILAALLLAGKTIAS